MLTDVTFISLLLLPLLFQMGERCCCCDGATVIWGQVNRYASTLHAQDVYLAADAKANYTDVVYGLTPESIAEGYTITAVHAYDMTEEQEGGDGGGAAGSVELLSGGVGQQNVTLRFRRHAEVAHLPTVHYQLIIYGLDV